MPIPTSTAKYDLNNIASYPGTGNTLYDLGVNNYDITLTNTSYITEPLYNSLEFLKGSSSTGTFSGSMSLGTTTPVFTFFMWVKPIDLSSGVNFGWFISYGKESAPIGGAPMILGEYSGSPNLSISFGSGIGLYNSGVALTIGEWACLTFTCDGTTNKLYLNGSLLGSVAKGASQINTPEELALNYLTQTAVGYISYELNYLEIFDTALTAGEVTELYNNTANRFGVNLKVKYDFSDPACYSGSGNTVYDLAESNNAELFNSPVFSGSGSQKYFQFSGTYPTAGYIGRIGLISGIGTNPVMSMNAWLRIPNYGSGTYEPFFGYGNDQGGGGIFTLWKRYSGVTSGIFRNNFGSDNTNVDTTSVQPLNEWVNICCTTVGTASTIYKNGAFVAHNLSGGGFIGDQSGGPKLSLGAISLGGYFGESDIAYFELYNVSLSPADVLSNYNAIAPRFDNLVFSYDFSDSACYPGSGTTVYDLSSSEYDLTISGSPTFGGTGQSKYFEFDGNASKSLFRGSVTGLGNTFSVNMWMSFDTTSGVRDPWSAGINTPSGNAPFFSINYLGPGILNNGFNYGVSYGQSGTLTTNTWYMVTTTYDGTNGKLYINGALVDTESQSGGTWASGSFCIGQNLNSSGNPGGEAFDGKVAIIDVWDTTLTSGEISTIFTNEQSRFGISPPVYQGIVGGRQFAQGFNG